jgi:[acyl-carrier-protein] S-malonyltransferase
LYSNVTGKLIESGAEAQKLALAQITSPVRWVDCMREIREFLDRVGTGQTATADADAGGLTACLEAGPGKVLQGLWKDSGTEIPCYAAGTVEDIGKIGN